MTKKKISIIKKLASLETQLFRLRHPDILPNSPQEKIIIKLINAGNNSETAYAIFKVMQTIK